MTSNPMSTKLRQDQPRDKADLRRLYGSLCCVPFRRSAFPPFRGRFGMDVFRVSAFPRTFGMDVVRRFRLSADVLEWTCSAFPPFRGRFGMDVFRDSAFRGRLEWTCSAIPPFRGRLEWTCSAFPAPPRMYWKILFRPSLPPFRGCCEKGRVPTLPFFRGCVLTPAFRGPTVPRTVSRWPTPLRVRAPPGSRPVDQHATTYATSSWSRPLAREY